MGIKIGGDLAEGEQPRIEAVNPAETLTPVSAAVLQPLVVAGHLVVVHQLGDAVAVPGVSVAAGVACGVQYDRHEVECGCGRRHVADPPPEAPGAPTQIPDYVCQNDGIRTAQPICRGGVVITVLPQPLNRAGVSSAHGSSQFLRQPAKLACIATLRQSLLRHVILFVRAPGPRLEA